MVAKQVAGLSQREAAILPVEQGGNVLIDPKRIAAMKVDVVVQQRKGFDAGTVAALEVGLTVEVLLLPRRAQRKMVDTSSGLMVLKSHHGIVESIHVGIGILRVAGPGKQMCRKLLGVVRNTAFGYLAGERIAQMPRQPQCSEVSEVGVVALGRGPLLEPLT